MRPEHARFIETADDQQLLTVQGDLTRLLLILNEPDVKRDTRALLKLIAQEQLDRVMRQIRAEQAATGNVKTLRAA